MKLGKEIGVYGRNRGIALPFAIFIFGIYLIIITPKDISNFIKIEGEIIQEPVFVNCIKIEGYEKRYNIDEYRYREIKDVLKKSKYAKIWIRKTKKDEIIEQMELDGVIVVKYDYFKQLKIDIFIILLGIILMPVAIYLGKQAINEDKEDEKYAELLTKEYENYEIQKEVDKIRKEYESKVDRLNYKSLSYKKRRQMIESIRKQYNYVLQEKLIDFKTEELLKYLNQLKQQNIIISYFNIDQQRQVIKNDLLNNLYQNKESGRKCFSCNAIISEKTIICSQCKKLMR